MDEPIIFQLPNELLIHTASMVPSLNDVISLSLTCKGLSQITQEDTLWRTLYLKRWNRPVENAVFDVDESENATWKQRYVSRYNNWKYWAQIFNKNQLNGVIYLILEGRLESASTVPDEITVKSLTVPMKPSPSDSEKWEIISGLTPHGIKTFVNIALYNNQVYRKPLAFFLSSKRAIEKGITQAWFEALDVTQLTLENATRKLLESVNLQSASLVTIVFTEFSQYFMKTNQKEHFSSADVVFSLMYAMLTLNTDLHNKAIKTKITSSQFIKMLRGFEYDDASLSDQYLEDLYSNIKKNPFVNRDYPQTQQEEPKNPKKKWLGLF